jgi:hypothetical protein
MRYTHPHRPPLGPRGQQMDRYQFKAQAESGAMTLILLAG